MSQAFVFVGNTQVGSELAESLIGAGYVAASDVDTADIIFTYCSSQAELENVYFDTGGVIASASENALLVDLSPSTPAFAKEINAMATVSNLHAVEAPLAVIDATREHAYSADNLMCYVSGDDDDLQKITPLLEALASQVQTCGSTGSAQLARCATTVARSADFVAAAEAFALVRHIDDAAKEKVVDALVPSVSPTTAALMKAACASSHQGTYSIDIINGEVEAAVAAADEVGLVLPQLEAGEYLLRMFALIDGASYAASALSLLYLDESAASEYGLDWSRAETMYANMDDHMHEHHDHHHHDHHHHDDDDFFDDIDYGYDDTFGFGYSPN